MEFEMMGGMGAVDFGDFTSSTSERLFASLLGRANQTNA
jgi:hypothetical protein